MENFLIIQDVLHSISHKVRVGNVVVKFDMIGIVNEQLDANIINSKVNTLSH